MEDTVRNVAAFVGRTVRSAKPLALTVVRFLLLGSVGLVTQNLGPGGPPGIYMSGAEIAATLDKAGAVARTGAAATVHQNVVVRRRSASDEPQFAIIHPLS